MMYLSILLMNAVCVAFMSANESSIDKHILDSVAIKELYNAIRPAPMQNPMPYSTDNKAQYEYWRLAHRIETRKTFEDIFTSTEQEHFNHLTNEIFATNSYKIQYSKFRADPKVVDQYKKVAAILAKNKLIEKGVKYQESPSLSTFNQFIEINHDISDDAYKWMIAGSMFLYYIRQIERHHREASLLM